MSGSFAGQGDRKKRSDMGHLLIYRIRKLFLSAVQKKEKLVVGAVELVGKSARL